MKLITLNIQGGIYFRSFSKFVQYYRGDIDIFCLQEVFHTTSKRKVSNRARVNIFHELTQLLPDFEAFYLPAEEGLDYKGEVDFHIQWGIAMFVKKHIPLIQKGSICVYDGKEGTQFGGKPRNLQYAIVKDKEEELLIANVHGIWTGRGKEDTPERIEQSNRINTFLEKHTMKKIVCGDFNLVPQQKVYKYWKKICVI